MDDWDLDYYDFLKIIADNGKVKKYMCSSGNMPKKN